MTSKRIFVTGASGCVGHYVVESLIQETNHELYLLVRNPDKLNFDYHARPGIHILKGDMRDVETFRDILKTIDVAILIATSWGGTQEAYDINVSKMIDLVNLLDPDLFQQVIYFSTASILDRNNQLLKEAGEIGSDYIRTKYLCFQKMSQLPIADKITTVFPTLLLGGDEKKPKSHISSGITQVAKWIGLLRFFKIEGSFHFIHSKDIAQIVRHLIDHPPPPEYSRKLVLGNDRITVDQAIEQGCAYLNTRIYFRFSLTPRIADVLIALFRIKMAEWDRFSMRYRHFTHQNLVRPATFGLPAYCATFLDVLKISDIKHPNR